MAHINVDVDYFEHRKTRRLIGRLGKGSEVLPLKLWRYGAKYHSEDGRLAGYTDQEIAAAAEWWGNPADFVAAMHDIGFLEKDGETYVIHDWLKEQGHVAALKERARSNANKRWDAIRNASSNADSNARDMLGKCSKPSNPSMPSKEPAAYRQFTDYFCQRWKEVHGETYPFEGQGPIAAKVWKSLKENLPLAKRVIDAYLAETTDFYAGHKLGKLQSDLARFMAKTTKNGAHPPTAAPLEKARRFE